LQGINGNCQADRSIERADNSLSLNPSDDILTQIIKAYEGYADLLRGQERKEFDEMLRLCYRYAESINAKGEPFPEEAVIMTLILKQHLIIKELKQAIEKLGNESEKEKKLNQL
ncbi:MAG: hypothetical protein ACJ70R_06385, partial [Nitrososphaera sp.]